MKSKKDIDPANPPWTDEMWGNARLGRKGDPKLAGFEPMMDYTIQVFKSDVPKLKKKKGIHSKITEIVHILADA